MNDIEILEELVSAYKDCFVENYNEMAVDVRMKFKDIQAIENLIAENKELKERAKWKPIKEYNRQKYDWVLVKYFDGDYECVPEVAEQRGDGKWYTSEKEIPFEVKYFFDMQSLLGKE